MSKILPRGVTGFTSVTVSLASFRAYSWKLPHGANGGESLLDEYSASKQEGMPHAGLACCGAHIYYADDMYADGAYRAVGTSYADGQSIRRRLFGLRLRQVTPTAVR